MGEPSSISTARPPKTPRPWRVPRVSSPDAPEVIQRWQSDAPTPWIDPVIEGATVLAASSEPDAPQSWGTASGDEAPSLVRWTFCVEADAASVLLWVNRLSDETALESTVMDPLPGTDLWVASFVMPDDWHASYCFLVAADETEVPWGTGDQVALRASLDRGVADPRNPHTSLNRVGVVQSVVMGPKVSTWWDSDDVTSTSSLAGWTREMLVVAGREVVVHTPPGGGSAPLVVMLDGEVWEANQGFASTFARLVAQGAIRAQRLVLVSSGGRDARWSDLGGDADGFLDWLCEHLLPAMAAVAPGGRGSDESREAADVTVVGQSLGGLMALRSAVRRPDAVGWALAQSASTWLEDLTGEAARWDAPRGRGGIHLAVGVQEWVLSPGHLSLKQTLMGAESAHAAGGRSVDVVGHQGGHDYAWWRHAVAAALVWQEQERASTDAEQ